ncbi:MAG TPA: cysteine desulfurase family protein [Candidatus Dormibacteraeota bacterium]|nr:cysteine desulfurase family protein [Candidatus Dormibacteraeota bacterium]
MPQQLIYLDHAAATPIDAAVLKIMQPYFREHFFNPSANYLPAASVRQDLNVARRKVAHWLGARNNEIVFTAGGTEANNLAIHGVMRCYPGAKLVFSAIEHESVRLPATEYKSRLATVTPGGLIDLKNLEKIIDDRTLLVSIMYANNEIGTIEPIKDISQLITKIRLRRQLKGITLPLYLHTDACQAANNLSLQTSSLGVDLMTLNGGKIYGPKQSGCLYVRSGVQIKPLLTGGGQEHGLRSGTENVAQIIGFAEALEVAQKNRHSETKRLANLQEQFVQYLKVSIPTALINGTLKKRLPSNLHLTLPGKDNERVLIGLEQAGILAAAGSACSASNAQPSHVLKAIGLSDKDAQSSIRFSLGRSTTDQHIKQAVSALTRLNQL